MADEGDDNLRDHDDDKGDREIEGGGVVAHDRSQGDEGKRSADAVHDEPAEARCQPAQRGRQEVAKESEGSPAFHHLGNPEARSHRREDGVRDGTHQAAERHAEDGGPEATAEDRDPEYADEHGCEFHVRRHPGPEQLDWTPMPLTIRDGFAAAVLDGGDFRAIFPLPNGYLRVYISGGCHSLSPLPTSRVASFDPIL